MSHSNTNLRFARRMSDINPYASGPVQPMPTARTGTIRDVLLAVCISIALAASLVAWWSA
jgi:hypothetical protein